MTSVPTFGVNCLLLWFSGFNETISVVRLTPTSTLGLGLGCTTPDTYPVPVPCYHPQPPDVLPPGRLFFVKPFRPK